MSRTLIAFVDVVAIVGDDLFGLGDRQHRQRRGRERRAVAGRSVAGAVTARAGPV